MAIRTQGTQLYVLLPTKDGAEVMEIECISNFSGGGNPADQLEDTCLKSNVKKFLKGQRTPGQATFDVSADPKKDCHHKLYELSESDEEQHENLPFALGWSDGKADPTVAADSKSFELPDSRTWFLFEGYVADFPFDFQGNSVVKTACSVQRTGKGRWIRKK